MMEQILRNGKDLIWLLGCALREELPGGGRLAQMDLDTVYRLAKEHSVATLAYYGLEKAIKSGETAPQADEALLKQWKDERMKSLRRCILLNAEREKLLEQLDQMGCWHMPLKGVILQNLYPKPEMRYMGDNDILFDLAYRSRLAELMKENGYTEDSVKGENHDVYFKQPLYVFEMHIFLFGTEDPDAVYRYYRDVESKLLKDGEGCGRRFSDEDFYIYMMAHGHKHFTKGGNGLRFLTDIFVYLERKEASMDWDYIRAEMKKMEILEFSREQEAFARKLFREGMEQPNAREQELLLYYLRSGTFGHAETKVENMLMKHTTNGGKVTAWVKVKYLLGRLFPPVEFYEGYMPIAYRYKVLLPFAVVYRLIRAMLTSFGRLTKELKTAVFYKQK